MEKDIRVAPDPGSPATRPAASAEEPSLGELFRQLAQDSTMLVRQEVALAKAEMRDNLRNLGKDLALLAVGGAVLLAAVLVLTAFLVVLVGDLMDNYWLGALIIGVVYAIIGAVLVSRGKSKLQDGDIKPERTLDSLREDKAWAQSEIQQVKRGLTS